MAKKDLRKTPKSKIKAALRMLSLRSRERSFAIRRDGYSCQVCGVKQSKAKGREVSVEVHHKKSIPNWQELYEAIYKYLLIDPDEQETLCKECHKHHE